MKGMIRDKKATKVKGEMNRRAVYGSEDFVKKNGQGIQGRGGKKTAGEAGKK